ncbi:MAG: cation transporter, partial [Nonomuraea sp.]|nr:cation transporter [Nonomuraea sp.]
MSPTSGHGHGHGHGHDHGVSADADRRWLTAALALIVAFMLGEVVVGLVAQSLALLSDAAHMLTDAASIVLALVAMRLAARPPQGGFTYGLKRAEILSAQANGLTLLLLALWLGYEAITRLFEPPEVAGSLVLVTALVGVVVNLAAAWCISRANRSSLNVEGAFQHILNDLFAFIATAIAGGVILLTGFRQADAIASLIVVVLMLKAGVGLVRESGRIFLEASPAHVDPDALGAELAASPRVVQVHDLHVWQITSGQPALSAHVLVVPDGDCHATRQELEELLEHTYEI